MEKNDNAEYTSEVDHHAVWAKMMPQSMIMDRMKVYVMTKDMASVTIYREDSYQSF